MQDWSYLYVTLSRVRSFKRLRLGMSLTRADRALCVPPKQLVDETIRLQLLQPKELQPTQDEIASMRARQTRVEEAGYDALLAHGRRLREFRQKHRSTMASHRTAASDSLFGVCLLFILKATFVKPKTQINSNYSLLAICTTSATNIIYNQNLKLI